MIPAQRHVDKGLTIDKATIMHAGEIGIELQDMEVDESNEPIIMQNASLYDRTKLITMMNCIPKTKAEWKMKAYPELWNAYVYHKTQGNAQIDWYSED